MIVSVAELMSRSYPRATTSHPRSTSSPSLLLGQLGLERVEDLDRPGVDALQHREVERHEVAEQDERHDALDRGPAARADPDDLGRLAGDELAGQRDARADARMLVGVLEEDRGEAAELGGALPAD